MNTHAKITPVERAKAELNEVISGALDDLMDRTRITGGSEARLRTDIDEIVMAAQNVILVRLKTKAYEINESHRNSGGGEAIDAESDAWDNAVETADPNGYDIKWMQEWTS